MSHFSYQSKHIHISSIERGASCEIRVHLVRFAETRYRKSTVMVNVSRWFRSRFNGVDWVPDKLPFRGGALLLPSEIPLVIEAMNKAIDRARVLGWRLQ